MLNIRIAALQALPGVCNGTACWVVPVHLATCDRIRDTAHRHGIKASMHCASTAFAAGAVKRGFDLIMFTSAVASRALAASSMI